MFDIMVTDDYALKAEVDEYKQVLLHMDVTNWTPSVAKEIKSMFIDAQEALHLEGFSKLYTVTPNPKFVQLVSDGEVYGVKEIGGVEHTIIVWDLEE